MNSAPPSTSTPKIAFGLLLGWLVPGLGHAVYRRVDKALYFGLLVLLAFALGLWLGEFRDVSIERFALYLAAQVWCGLPTALALVLTKGIRIDHDIPGLDVGLLYTSVAGLLNVVVMVDLYEIHLKLRSGPASAVAAPATIGAPRS